ncbi:penicillin-binding transpeptidase domain-containing protein [Microbacterium kribbense]|uniref:Penicillin-binding transpeptidase domain-containing protein n=1 Tax=Microbacterium kribbense TaxID=433645 RepID=A0ABP7G1K5_9MICO
MTKELRRLTIIMLLMFLALFGSTSVIQVVQADSLAQNQNNKRAMYDSFDVQRGSIIASGSAIAYSTPSKDVYSWQRQYVDPLMWAPVTGYYNPVLQSRTGIEKALNQQLSGTGSSQFLTRVEQIVTGQPARGSNVMLSLDAKVQKAAYEALGKLRGAVIAIQPKTGRILAMVSSPGFDPNILAAHNANAVNAAYDKLNADPTHPLYNRAIGGDLDPPGSTFKLVTVSAALASGQFTPQSKLPNPVRYTLPGTTTSISNDTRTTCGPGKDVTIADALRLSCNIPMAELAVKVGGDAIRAEAEKYGFNTSFDLPLPSTPSSYPPPTDSAQTALTGFGQGKVTATALQMAMVSAGIANGGVVMKPRMVDEVVGPDLSVQEKFDNAEYGRALDPALNAELVRMMVANVSDGVATNARIDGVAVAGKTGTAQNGDNNPFSLWFTGFAPAEDPQVAVAVVVENGGGVGQSGSGNSIAAPIVKKVMEAVLGK